MAAMARITRKQLTQVVYYANAWCDEYSGERPYKVKDFVALFQEIDRLNAALVEAHDRADAIERRAERWRE